MEVGAVDLVVGRAVETLVLGGERELLDDLRGIVEAEHVGCGADRHGRDRFADAEMGKHVHGVGAELDAGADLAQLRCLLVDLDVEARLQQAGRRRQSADSGTRDKYLFARHHLHPAMTKTHQLGRAA